MDQDTVRELATGEVYLADRAQKLGLVDDLGDLDSAIDIAAELSGAPRNPVFLRPRRGLRERLFGPLAESVVQAVAEQVEQRLWHGRLRL